MFLLGFEYIGTGVILLGNAIRAMIPSEIKYSFILSIIGGILLGYYTLITKQYGLLVLNAFSITMAFIGLYNWSKVRIDKKHG